MSDQGQEGLSGGTFGSMPTIFGNLPNVVKQQRVSIRKVSCYWQFATVDGNVQNLVKVQMWANICHRACQCGLPMGSGRPPLVAGEFCIMDSKALR